MGSPGAGGGGIDYGFTAISIPEENQAYEIIDKDYNFIAPRSAIFYDYSSKVVYIGEGNKIPHFSQPDGSSNNGMIAYRDLTKDIYGVILEEDFTSYKITKLNEQDNTLEFETIKYTIPEGCSSGIIGDY
ncbi:MAG: hypothetical protein WC319_04065 [Candidatus Paceibacterota bacterium]|jgi:hypothetical protein